MNQRGKKTFTFMLLPSFPTRQETKKEKNVMHSGNAMWLCDLSQFYWPLHAIVWYTRSEINAKYSIYLNEKKSCKFCWIGYRREWYKLTRNNDYDDDNNNNENDYDEDDKCCKHAFNTGFVHFSASHYVPVYHTQWLRHRLKELMMSVRARAYKHRHAVKYTWTHLYNAGDWPYYVLTLLDQPFLLTIQLIFSMQYQII